MIMVAILASVGLLFVYTLLKRPNVLVNQPHRQVCIPHGMNFQALQQKLQQEGCIGNVTTFKLAARLLKYDCRVRPGVYQLQTNMSNLAALRLLRAGTQKPVKVVINNVRTRAELAAKLTNKVEMQAADFEKLLSDAAFVRQYGFTVENVLSMFIPNTYEVYWTITPEKLFQRMYKEYQRFWNKQRRASAQKMGLTPTEVMVLASIVQREVMKIEEAPMMAGVFVNRLKRGMRLQSDVTVWHAIGDTSVRRILQKDTQIASAYNTYKTKRLPPGPINVPTIAVIDAVLNYTQHDYLFFCGKDDLSGYTYFAKTYREHLRYAKRYQRALNKAGIYR